MSNSISRRSVIAGAFAGLGLGAFRPVEAALQASREAPVSPNDKLRITELETFPVRPRWLFLKVHTNAGIIGLGEPITEGRALTCAAAVKHVLEIFIALLIHHLYFFARHLPARLHAAGVGQPLHGLNTGAFIYVFLSTCQP